MNILIVGNGFDLSHYLPTKYDHFMVAMGAIENWDEQKGEMGFDDLFGSLYEKENYFFKYTKAIYQTGEIKISVEKINNIKAQLKKNVWYQYFSDHMREVRTWIDFEEKINKALVILIEFIDKISIYLSKSNAIDLDFYSLKKVFKKYEIEVQENELDIATIFKIFDEKIVKEEIDPDLELFHDQKDSISRYIEFNKINISCIRKEHVGFSYFNTENFINELYNMLNKLISIFDFYLQYIVDSMLLSNDDCFVRGHRNYYSEIYSFNYTSTYKKYYNKSQSIDYLHGKLGRGQI
ncbi:AbiH family protein [Acinetobacter vivianii]